MRSLALSLIPVLTFMGTVFGQTQDDLTKIQDELAGQIAQAYTSGDVELNDSALTVLTYVNCMSHHRKVILGEAVRDTYKRFEGYKTIMAYMLKSEGKDPGFLARLKINSQEKKVEKVIQPFDGEMYGGQAINACQLHTLQGAKELVKIVKEDKRFGRMLTVALIDVKRELNLH